MESAFCEGFDQGGEAVCCILEVFARTSLYLSDVNHEMDVMDCMVGCPPPGTAGHCTKVHCSREGFISTLLYFQSEKC